MREATFSGDRNKNCPALKIPRLCSPVLLVEVRLKQGKLLGNEEGKGRRKRMFLQAEGRS
jgi:hypothetical protein